jgi:hypothetical protein
MRLLLAAAVFIAALSFDLRPAPAYEQGPWCAVIPMGEDSVREDCQYRSFEACLPNALSTGRGFCRQNQRWDGWYAPAPRQAAGPAALTALARPWLQWGRPYGYTNGLAAD